jgi:hypothetical protein
MNSKNKRYPLFKAAGFFLTGLFAALFLACNNPVDLGGPPAQNDPLPQTPPSGPPSLVSTVTFDKNGGTTEAEPSQIDVTWPDNTIDLPEPPLPPAEGGLVFRGWNTKADGSGTRFTAATEISKDLTVYARWGAPFETMVTDVAEIADYLDSQSGGTKIDPVPLVLDIDLGNMADGSPWYALLDALKEADKYVALDLSDCTMTGAAEDGTVFRPNYAYRGPSSILDTYPGTGGKQYIVELTLPLRAKKIFGGWLEGYTFTPIPAFRYFSSLAKIRGDNIEAAYQETGFSKNAIFSGSSSLKEAHFEKLTVAPRFFEHCTKLESVHCPSLADIGHATFYGCTSLKTFDFSNVQKIGYSAFGGCSSLKVLDLGQSAVTKIPGETGAGVGMTTTALPMAAFQGCSSLETIVFPAGFTDIGTFKDVLEKPSDPPLRGGKTFNGCTKIKEVTFLGDPAAIVLAPDGPPYETGLDDALITCALSGSTPEERIGTYVKSGSSWSKQ